MSDAKLKNASIDSFPEKAVSTLLHGDTGIPNGEKHDRSCTEGHNSVTELASEASVEAPSAETEQATYSSANNDLKGTKAYQEADVPGLYNLAMAIIDYRGHRVVAQVNSILYSLYVYP